MDDTAGRTGIEGKIFRLRGQRVMLDRDLAAFYGVPTRALSRAAQRVAGRFPPEFLFQLNDRELLSISEQGGKQPRRAARRPVAFTEQGIHAISYFLRSPRAVDVSIALIRSFHAMRNIVDDYELLFSSVQEVKRTQELESKRLWQMMHSIRELEQFRRELSANLLRSAPDSWAAERLRRAEELEQERAARADRLAFKYRDLFFLALALSGALLATLILFPR